MLDLLSHPFVRYAFAAGTAIAICSGLVGYFLVLRSQVFTGDALSHVAFTGALGALAFGFDARVGLFVTTIAVAVALGLLGPRGRADDVVIGSVFAWVLGLGVLFLSIFTTSRATGDSAAGTTVLFGSIFGLEASQVVVVVVVAAVVLVALVVIARPLLFASIDASVAAARGVPVTALGLVFLGARRRHRGRGHPGGRRAPAARPAGGTRRSGAAPHDPAVAGDVAVGRHRGRRDVDGAGHQLRGRSIPPSFAIVAVCAAVYVGATVVTSAGRSRRSTRT